MIFFLDKSPTITAFFQLFHIWSAVLENVSFYTWVTVHVESFKNNNKYISTYGLFMGPDFQNSD